MSQTFLPLCLSLLAGFALNARAVDVTFRSGMTQVALIELYSSEGCSSCPPAEKWLGELREDPELWKTFVPVAFHVNYWDRLGWRDVFATPEFTEREYRYSRAWRTTSVYTPCFVRNGEECRPRARRASQSSAIAAGELSLTRTDSGECHITFTPVKGIDSSDKLEVSVALLGSGVVSPVHRGENSGRELHHEFVALVLRWARLERSGDGNYSATLSLEKPADREFPVISRLAVAAWVTASNTLVPIQATGGWLN